MSGPCDPTPIALLCAFLLLVTPWLTACALAGPANATNGFGGRESGPPTIREAIQTAAIVAVVGGIIAFGVWAWLHPEDDDVPWSAEP